MIIGSVKPKHLGALVLLLIVTVSEGRINTAETVPFSHSTSAPQMQLKPGIWVVMGSSTAAGTGAPRGKGWAALLGSAYAPSGAEVVNIAKRGAVTYRGLSTNAIRVTRRPTPDRGANIDAALARKPVLLILSYPTNDTAFGYSADETVNNLLAIRAQAQAAGVAVVVISTQPRDLNDDRLTQLRAIDDRLSASIGACFVAVRQALEGADGRLAPKYDAGDGVHLTKAGHALIAGRLTELIQSERCVRVARD